MVIGGEISVRYAFRYVKGFHLALILLFCITGFVSCIPSPLQTTPQQILINGTLGVSSFQAPFNVTALNSNITDLSFAVGNLKMTAPTGEWMPNVLIPGSNILVTPDIKTIRKGRIQEYVISVNNIPLSGRYNGSLYLTYKEQPDGVQEPLPISLVAYKLNSSPIFLQFDNDFPFIGGGTDPKQYPIELREDNGRIPLDVMESLNRSLKASLVEMVNSDDKSIRFGGIDYFKIESISKGSNSIILNAKFTNPNKTPGKYTGILTVYSNSSFWPIISVPVEMKIRLMPWWAAFLLILLGVVLSYRINDWNKKGREINNIQHKISGIREKTKGEITKTCKETLETKLKKAEEKLLYEGKLEDARKEVDSAETELEKCKNNKKELNERAKSIENLKGILEGNKKRANRLISASPEECDKSPVIAIYLKKLQEKLNMLQNNLSNGCYNSTDAKVADYEISGGIEKSLNERLAELFQEVEKFTELLDNTETLKQYAEGTETDLRETFLVIIKKNLEAFKDISDKFDVKDLLKDVKNKRKQISKESTHKIIKYLINLKDTVKEETLKLEIDELIDNLADDEELSLLQQKIEKLRKKVQDIHNAKFKPFMQKDQISINYMFDSGARICATTPTDRYKAIYDSLDAIAKVKEGTPRNEAQAKEIDSVILSPKPLPFDKSFARGQSVIWTANTIPPSKNNEIEYMFSIGNQTSAWTKDNTFPWTPQKTDKKFDTIHIRARYEKDPNSEKSNSYNFELMPPEPDLSDWIKKLSSPEMKKWIYENAILIIAIAIASIVGLVQLYFSNSIFGAGNDILGYLTLIFWGFGIEASTAKVADLFKNLVGG